MAKLSIDGIAKTLGVSKSTVSRALNSTSYVAPETKARIMAAVESLGYRRNLIARNLRNLSSNFIGLIIPDIANEFFSMLAKTLETGLRQEGYALFLCNSEENAETEAFYIDSLLDNQVAALVITSATGCLYDRIRTAGIPVVFTDRYIADTSLESLCCVTSDNESGGRVAVEALVARGATSLFVVGDERHIYGTENRVKAALKRATELGLPAVETYAPVSAKGGYDTVMAAIAAGRGFDSVFCTTDTMAFGALRALSESGRRIPEDVQVIGFDGIELGAYTNPPLTTFKQDIVGLGEATKTALIQMIGRQPVERLKRLPVELIERSSTRSPLRG